MFQYYTSRFNLVQLQTTLCHCSEVERKCWPIKSSDFLYSKKMFLSRRFYILMQISVKYNWPFVRERNMDWKIWVMQNMLCCKHIIYCVNFFGISMFCRDDKYISYQLSKIYMKHVLDVYIWVTSKSISLMYPIWSLTEINYHSL